MENNVLNIYIKLKRKPSFCDRCGGTKIHIKDNYTRKIKHGILNGINCIINHHIRRYKCTYCNHCFNEESPFVSRHHNISKYTIKRVLDELKNPHNTFKSVANNTNLTTTKVIDIFDQYVSIKPLSLPEILCIDEVYVLKVPKHKYACVLMDFETHEIIDILIDRKKDYLHSYFSKIPENHRNRVKYVSIDMWKSYKDISKIYFKNAVICVDSFHVIKALNDALNKLRITIMRNNQLNSKEYYLLKQFGYLLTKNRSSIKSGEKNYNKKFSMYLNYYDILELLLKIDPKLKEAYNLKERYVHFNKTATTLDAKERLEALIIRFIKSDLYVYHNFINCITNWKEEIINSFNIVHGKRISNGPIESKNRLIKLIKYNANGYKNFDRFRDRVLYTLNKSSKANLSGKFTSKKYEK